MAFSCRAVSSVVPNWRPNYGPMDYFSGRDGPTGPSGWWRPIGLDWPVSCHAGGEGGDGADGSEEGGDDCRQWEGVGKTELGFFLIYMY
jgi:hypothetical protein